MPASLRWGASTHPGQVRTNNEDAFAADDGMWVVADGMGGHLAGEVASAYTIDALRAANRAGITSSADLVTAVQQANDTIRHEALTNPGRRGMGTTVTALAVMHHPDTPQLVVANVGDSRTYLWRDGELSSVTVDHSYVQELVSGGEITAEEARTHPRRNIVTRALGIEPGVMVDTWTLAAVRGDRYILCSDGLVDEVSDAEIIAVCAAEADPQRVAEQLVAVANRNGGRDNVTVVVVDVVDGEELPPPVVEPPAEVPAPPTVNTDEDDTARINRTLQIDAIAGIDPDAAAETAGTAELEAPLPPPASREVFVDGQPLGASLSAPAAQVPPATPVVAAKRRPSKAAIAFWAVIAVIIFVVVAVIISAVTGDDSPTPTTVTSTTSTSVPATSTTTATTTPVTTTGSVPTASTLLPTIPPTAVPPPSATTP